MRLLITFCLSILLSLQTYASDYYWVGGSGNWSDYAHHWATSSGGTTFQPQVPTNLDNVFFDQNSGFTMFSGTVSVDQTIVYCKNMDWTGILQHVDLKSSFNNNTLKIFGSLKMFRFMDIVFPGSFVSFEATTPGHTITCDGKPINAATLYFNGINGEWTFTDAFIAYKVVHKAGTIRTNNFTLNIASFEASGSAMAAFEAGNSIFNINQNSAYFSGEPVPAWTINNPNYQFNPSQIVFNFLGSFPVSFNSNTYNYNIINSGTGLMDFNCTNCSVEQLTLTKDGYISGNSAFQKLILSQGGIYSIRDTIKIKDAGSLVANGTCSKPIFMQSKNRNENYTIRKNTGTVDVSYVYLENAGTKGNAVFNANNSYALNNVSGWNISTPTINNFYWIGGTGSWSDPSHWSLTSGGSISSGCVPTYNDNVYFDQNSGFTTQGTVTLDLYKAQCKSMDWSKINNNVTFRAEKGYLYISGSLTLSPKLTFSFQNTNIILNSKSTGNTITCAGKTIPEKFVLDGIGGEWMLTDSLGAKDIVLYSGSLITNNQNITMSSFTEDPNSPNPTKLNLQNSTVKITGINQVWFSLPKLDFQCGTSTIILNNTTDAQQLYSGSSSKFYNIYSLGLSATIEAGTIRKLYFAGDGNISGNQTYDSLIFSEGHKYILASANYIINKALIANGMCGKFISITGNSFFKSTFYKTSGTVICNGLILSDCNAGGGASFWANNSVNNTPVTGWTISAYVPRNLYWVGGAGNWSDLSHWSLISGGTGGECPPVQFDNVYFNQLSGLVKKSTITASTTPEFNDMDWSGINAKCTFSTSAVNVYGSMTLHDSVTVLTNPTFLSSSDEIIKTCQSKFGAVYFKGNGSWKLLDNLATSTGSVYHNGGTLNANGNTITIANWYQAQGGIAAVLDLRNSKMVIAKGGFAGSSNPVFFKLLGNNSIIEFMNQDPFWSPAGINYFACCSSPEPATGGIQFGKVICRNNNGKFYIREGKHSFTYLYAEGGADISSSCTFDTLSLTPGRTYTFKDGTTQTINSLLDAHGQPGFPIEILSSTVNKSIDIYKASGTVCAEYLYLKDIHAIGGATFYAGDNGANVSNNTGWIFKDCNSVTTAINQENITSDLLIYPVPANNDLHILNYLKDNYWVSLRDTQGNEILNTTLEGGYEQTINTSVYVPGIYYLTISEKETSKTYKISIVH